MSGPGFGGPKLASMAWRNVWRNRRRTLLTLSSIAFGSMLAVMLTGIGDANWREMIDLAARLGGGHVTVQHSEYLDTPTLSRSVTGTERLRQAALRDPEVERVVGRITGFLMLSTAGQSYGAGFVALDPETEDASTLSLLEALSEGKMFERADSPGIVLGKKLAENLDLKLGRKVVYTLTDKHGEIVREAARLTGIVRTGSPSVDAGIALLPLDRMRGTIGFAPDEVVQVGLFLPDQRQAEGVAARVGATLGQQISALPWYETQPDLAAFITMKVAGAYFMEIVMAILVAAGIFNTLFMSVMERLREFGILLAIGFSPARLFALVMLESLWLALVGLVAAAALTAGPYYYMATTGIDISEVIAGGGTAEVAGIAITSIMRASIYPENLLYIALAVVAATLLSGLYPAWRAGRVEPVETIRLV
ncbi:MAG: ABC transporter permease [Myxococcales bacterium]|nr:ABC transporter permease [Myxococcales bacterium]